MRPFPREPVFLAAAPKCAIPEPYHVAMERSDRRAVRGNRVIGEVASDDLPQPTPLFGYRLMHALAQLLLDLGELRPHAVAPGLTLYDELTSMRLAADEEASRPVGFHHQPLSEPSVTLSRHWAPIRQTYRSCQFANERKDARFAGITFAGIGSRGSCGL